MQKRENKSLSCLQFRFRYKFLKTGTFGFNLKRGFYTIAYFF